MRREDAEAIFEAGREAVVETLLKLSVDFDELSIKIGEQSVAMRWLVDRVGQLEREVDDLEREAARDSRNSSQPPSQDLPQSRAERRREARAKLKELSKAKRKPGGQPGMRVSTGRRRGPSRSTGAPSICPRAARVGIGSTVARSGSAIR